MSSVTLSCHGVTTMTLPATQATLKLASFLPWNSGGQALYSSCRSMSKAVLLASKTSPTHLTIPPLTPIKSCASCLFQHVSCNLITDLSIFSSFNSLLVVINHGPTKGVILCPIKKTITTEGVATFFSHKVYLHFGLYDKIISDHGPQFISAFTKELDKLLNYDLLLSTTYHSQC